MEQNHFIRIILHQPIHILVPQLIKENLFLQVLEVGVIISIVMEIKPVNDGSLNTTEETELLYHNQQYPSRLWLPVARNRPLSQEPSVPATEPVINVQNVNVTAEEDEKEDSTADTLQFFVPR